MPIPNRGNGITSVSKQYGGKKRKKHKQAKKAHIIIERETILKIPTRQTDRQANAWWIF